MLMRTINLKWFKKQLLVQFGTEGDLRRVCVRVEKLAWFYGISTNVDYLLPNPCKRLVCQ